MSSSHWKQVADNVIVYHHACHTEFSPSACRQPTYQATPYKPFDLNGIFDPFGLFIESVSC
jgi:hypothetical protein